MRRPLPEPAPVAPQVAPSQARPPQQHRPAQEEQMGLDIPTFLRRQSN